MNMASVLNVQNLTKITRPRYKAVDNISFDLKQGEILGFLGPNGAGKTTTIQMLLGTLTPTSGTVSYFGKDLNHGKSDILKYVSFASTYLRLPPTLTVYENLDVYGRLYSLNKAQRSANIEKYLRFFDMWGFKNRKVAGLSAGQMTRVMLAKAFLPEPKVVLLDEPTASLDPDVCAVVRAFVLEQQRSQGTSMIFTSHNMAEVEEVCDRVLVIKHGKIIADEKPEILAQSVSMTKVCFLGIERDKFSTFAEGKFKFEFHPHETIAFIDEGQISWLLSSMAQTGISFSQVSINKPNLEDYFLHIART